LGGFSYEAHQNTHDQFFVPDSADDFIHRNGEIEISALLSDEALLLHEHEVLQEGKSRVLQWSPQKGRRMLLQKRYVPNAFDVSG
jgi:hypothetical protein